MMVTLVILLVVAAIIIYGVGRKSADGNAKLGCDAQGWTCELTATGCGSVPPAPFDCSSGFVCCMKPKGTP